MEVSEGTKESVRQLIADQFQLGADAPVLTRLIRDVVGLRQDQVGFIEHYRERLLKDGIVGPELENQQCRRRGKHRRYFDHSDQAGQHSRKRLDGRVLLRGEQRGHR